MSLRNSQTLFITRGINEPAIIDYFTNLNNGQFIKAAELFSEHGWLKPPFEEQIQGRDKIAQYLEKEASNMKFLPGRGELLTDDGQLTQYQLQGKVQTDWFTVNVAWSIQLNPVKEITAVEVNLLASLNELLGMNRR